METYCWLALPAAGCWVTAQAYVCRLWAVTYKRPGGSVSVTKCALEVSCTWDALYKSTSLLLFVNYLMSTLFPLRHYVREVLLPQYQQFSTQWYAQRRQKASFVSVWAAGATAFDDRPPALTIEHDQRAVEPQCKWERYCCSLVLVAPCQLKPVTD